MEKQKRFLKISIITFTILAIISIHTIKHADVGSHQRYKSSSSSSGSSSYRRSTSGSTYRSSSGSTTLPIPIPISIGGFILFMVIVAILKNSQIHRNNDFNTIIKNNNIKDNTREIAEEIKQIDPNFSEQKFLAWAKEVFIKLQKAWTKRDWSEVRPFESDELFEQHSAQLQEYIDSHKINIIERISVSYAELHDFLIDGDKEILSITLKAVMIDYIIDEKTKEVLMGNKVEDKYMTYRLVFARKIGRKTKEGTNDINTTNCPNCGAPTEITSSGKCQYCGSIITTGEHDWVLTSLESI
ncbi:MAG: Tim44 domain-containing protein [Clostridia bacterium]|jgi:hypothetical protein|nr:Tim44 domain-containing protein [Clostridia bacterium]